MMGGQKVAPTPQPQLQPPVASTAMAPSAVVPFQGRPKPEDSATHITVSLILLYRAVLILKCTVISSYYFHVKQHYSILTLF
jgi:hypothetical protein